MGPGEQPTGFERVLVAVDGSSRDEHAVALATTEAALRGWPLDIVHVEDLPAPVPELYGWTPAQTVEHLLAAAKACAERTDPEVPVAVTASVGRPENVLEELSRSTGLLVVGSGRKVGTAQFLLGTVSLNVAAHAACPVLVVGEPLSPVPRGQVVVGVDGSQHSVPAVRVAAQEALLRDAELVVHSSWYLEFVDGAVVTEPDSPRWRQVEERHRAMQADVLAEALGSAGERPRLTTEVVHGAATNTLVEASASADVVVVGNRGRGGFLGKLLGSVTMRLLQQSHCPVLVTRAP